MSLMGRLKTLLDSRAVAESREIAQSEGLPLFHELEKEYAKAILSQMKSERREGVRNGAYETCAVSFVFNHERLEGSTVTEDMTRTILETRTSVTIADLTADERQAANHLGLFDAILDTAGEELSLDLIRRMHVALMGDVMVTAGQWKTLPNAVADLHTCAPTEVESAMEALVRSYLEHEPTVDNIARFHARFEAIHPFQDGNGRVGRAIAFRECLHAERVPLIVTDATKDEYYSALHDFQTGGSARLLPYFHARQEEFARLYATLVGDMELRARVTKALGINEKNNMPPFAEFSDERPRGVSVGFPATLAQSFSQPAEDGLVEMEESFPAHAETYGREGARIDHGMHIEDR